MKKIKKTNKELRKFGLTLAVAFALFGFLFLWRGKPAAPYLLGIAGFFLVFGLLLPRVLAPIEWLWMKMAHAMGWVVTRVLLTITFFLVITPLGFLMRLMGKFQLRLKFDPGIDSYWEDVDPNGPTSRADKPY